MFYRVPCGFYFISFCFLFVIFRGGRFTMIYVPWTSILSKTTRHLPLPSSGWGPRWQYLCEEDLASQISRSATPEGVGGWGTGRTGGSRSFCLYVLIIWFLKLPRDKSIILVPTLEWVKFSASTRLGETLQFLSSFLKGQRRVFFPQRTGGLTQSHVVPSSNDGIKQVLRPF